MAFNIAEFKATLDKHGGLSRNNVFTVQFTGDSSNMNWNDNVFSNRDLIFFCKSATFPGINLNIFDYRPNNLDLPQSMPIGLNYEQIECVFMLDDRNRVMNYFHTWMRGIINYSETTGELASPATSSSTAPQLVYELGYRKDYSQTMTITRYSKNPSSITNSGPVTTTSYDDKYSCTLYNVYPTHIGAFNMAWDENDTYAIMPVGFSYSNFEMSTFSNSL